MRKIKKVKIATESSTRKTQTIDGRSWGEWKLRERLRDSLEASPTTVAQVVANYFLSSATTHVCMPKGQKPVFNDDNARKRHQKFDFCRVGNEDRSNRSQKHLYKRRKGMLKH